MSDFIDRCMDFIAPAMIVVLELFLVGVLALGASWVVCEAGAKKWDATATVVGGRHNPSTLSTGVGPVFGGNGGVAVVTTGHSETWDTLLMVDGEVYVFNNATVFARCKDGDKVRVTMKHNSISGTSIDLVHLPEDPR